MASNLYIDTVKYFRDEEGKWALPKGVLISDTGKEIVEKDPNIEDETLDALVKAEWAELSEPEKEMVLAKSPKEIADKVFFENGEIGLTHLSQCICDDKKQSLAELIVRYSEERRMRFVIGAIYLKALTSVYKLFYYTYTPSKGYRKVAWEPSVVYIPPEHGNPPIKKKRRIRKKELVSIPPEKSYPLYACPICGSQAKLLRCGKNSRLWHACCMDPSYECVNYAGLKPTKTEKMAMIEWNNYVKSACDAPRWSSEVKAETDMAKEKEE